DLDRGIMGEAVVVGQADDSGCGAAADGRRRVGTVAAVERAAEIHGARAERIGLAAGHEARQIRRAGNHLGWRRPIRPLGLALDALHAGPGETLTADADAVADRLTAGKNIAKVGVRRIDDDRAG